MNNEKERFYCKTCQRDTNHDLLYDESESMLQDNGSKIWKCYETIRCLGCGTISLHYSECHTENSDPHSHLLSAKSQYFPKDRFFRNPIEDVQKLPVSTQNIYFEVLSALNEDLPILTAIGLRVLIESVCRERAYTWTNLYDGIENLSVDGILSFTQVEFLHACRFMGNTAAHEIAAPSKKQLLDALDIIETLLTTMYVLPDKAKSIDIRKKAEWPPKQ